MRSACIIAAVVCSTWGVGNASAQEKPDANTPTPTDANGSSANTSTQPRAEILIEPVVPEAKPGSTIPGGASIHQSNPYPYYPYSNGAYPQTWGGMGQSPKKTNWYGWQTLIGVVAGDVFTLVGTSVNVGPLIYAGLGAHFITGPIVQWAHGHVGMGFASLGLNVGLPTLGYLTGALVGSGFGAIVLGGIGYIAGPALDIGLLSTETVEDTSQGRRGARLLLPSSVGIMPMLDQNRRGLLFVGQF